MSPITPSACLLIFARYPEVGQVKTRLIPALGPEGATTTYRQMATHVIAQVRELRQRQPLAVTVWFTGGSQAGMATWLGADLTYQQQSGGDLGQRLQTAFQVTFDQGYQVGMAIGTDCPSLTPAILDQGWQALQHHDLVLGPATDGGYYLIGLNRPVPELFQGIAWSTAVVLEQTVAIADRLGLTRYHLPALTDVDTPQDLAIWQQIRLRSLSNHNCLD